MATWSDSTREVATAGLAALLALQLAAGVGVAVVRRPDRAGGQGAAVSPTVSATPSSTPTPDAAARAVAAALPSLLAFVERTRGLRFTRPVRPVVLDDAAFRRRLLDSDEPSEPDPGAEPEIPGDVETTLKALGLVPVSYDLYAGAEDLAGDSVGGYYDFKTHELVVRGSTVTPLVRTVLVHELTHALQHQHFAAAFEQYLRDNGDDESGLAFTGLFEGDASAVEKAYYESLPATDQAAADAEEERVYGDAGADEPEILSQLFGFPYAVGPDFVAAIRAAAGQKGLDAAFRRPPTTSEHLLHPALFLRGEGVRPVAGPQAGDEVVDQGVMGEVGLALLLADRLDRRSALDAARGWGGDRYVSWSGGRGIYCTRVAIQMDNAAERRELAAALDSWAGKRSGSSVTGDDILTLTSCA